MTEYRRTCSECDTLLTRPNQRTCSTSCRAKRSRRLKRTRKDVNEFNTLPDHQQQVAQAVRNEVPDIAHELTREALAPVVREALTEDVLRSLQTMVGLAPLAVAALEEDLRSDDAKIRQKATDLWLRYTVGHGAILRPEPDEAAKGMVVHFNLPRPESAGTEAQEDDTPAEAVELRTCNMCGVEKPVAEFVVNSDRCVPCHEELSEKARGMLA